MVTLNQLRALGYSDPTLLLKEWNSTSPRADQIVGRALPARKCIQSIQRCATQPAACSSEPPAFGKNTLHAFRDARIGPRCLWPGTKHGALKCLLAAPDAVQVRFLQMVSTMGWKDSPFTEDALANRKIYPGHTWSSAKPKWHT